jgi:acetylornithine deacetylase/succinyl-diaminopimelate desuccinylase-like protein
MGDVFPPGDPMPRFATILTSLVLISGSVAQAADITASRPSSASKQARANETRFRELYKELVEINTTVSAGSCTRAVEAMRDRLAAAGYSSSDLHVIVDPQFPKDGNLVAILRGSSPKAKAILLLAHIDVVEANREDWERDPFKLTEEDGFFYARGASDDKAMAAIFTDMLIRFKEEGYRPKRTLKMALTCGEETPDRFNGVRYLVQHHRDLIDAEFALNEGGGGRYDANTGKYQYNGIQAGEKLYQDFTLTTTNPGGHSSRPTPDNAIYQLAAALAKIAAHEFPIELNDTTRAYLNKFGAIVGGDRGADMRAAAATGDAGAIERLKRDPSFNSMLHTTCIATKIEGGHANNALPQRAVATVNCRIFPGRSPQEVLETLRNVVGDPGVKIEFAAEPERASPPPPLTREILEPIEKLTADMFPGVPVIPVQLSGATDGRFLTPEGIPTYGVSGIFGDGATSNAHGLNERIRVQSLLEGREFLYRLVRMYAK